jgi:hypothetical protein
MLKRFLVGLLLAASASAPAWAACGSTINPTVPAQGALIASPPVRSNFAAAYSDLNNLFSENYGGSAPTNPCAGQVWLNTSTTPASLQQWDGAQWVTIYSLNASAHTSSIPIGNLPLGTSVGNPGTGKIEALFPPSTVTQSNYAFGTADLFKKTRRSNGGTPMADTLPAAGATGLANGTQINIANVDASATDTVTAGSGTTIDGNSTLVIQPGRDIWLIYDLANAAWRGAGNSRTAVLFAGTPPTASQLWGGSATLGSGAAVVTGSCLSLSSGTLSDTCIGAQLPATSFLLKGNGIAGNAVAATPGTDYITPGEMSGLTAGNSSQLLSGTWAAPGCIGCATPNVGDFSAITMGSGVTGFVIMPYTGGGYADIYSTNVTPGATNFAFATNGGTSVLNGTAQSVLAVGSAVIINATSSGTAVTGALSASGNVTLPGLATSGTITGSHCQDSSGHVMYVAGTNCYASGSASNYIAKTTTYTASNGDNIFADTSGGAFTITLPASPAEFAQVCVSDAAGTFGTYTLTIAGNSSNIMGSSANMTVTTNYASFCLMYYTTTPGWRIK